MSGLEDHHHPIWLINRVQVRNSRCHYEVFIEIRRKNEGEMLRRVEEEVIHTSVKRVFRDHVRVSRFYVRKERQGVFGITG